MLHHDFLRVSSLEDACGHFFIALMDDLVWFSFETLIVFWYENV